MGSSPMPDGDGVPGTPRRCCVLFLLAFLAACVLVAAVNFVVNPYGIYPTSCFTPIVSLSRREKVRLARRYEAPPQAVVLGSSRSMKIEPAYLTRKTGLSAFNAGFGSARTEDHLAFLRFLCDDLGQAPRLLIIGIDPEAFHNTIPVDARLVASPQLARHVPEVTHRTWARFTDLIRFSQTTSSVLSLWFHVRGFPSRKSGYQPDGLVRYYDMERAAAKGSFDLGRNVEKSLREYGHRFAGFSELAPWRKKCFEQLIELCQEKGITVKVFVTPMHPRVVDMLRRETSFPARRRELNAYLAGLAATHDFAFFDFSEIESFGGDETNFYDGAHILEQNARLIVDRILDPE